MIVQAKLAPFEFVEQALFIILIVTKQHKRVFLSLLEKLLDKSAF